MRALEAALAAHLRRRGRLAFVSGHATNVTVIGHLIGPRDLVAARRADPQLRAPRARGCPARGASPSRTTTGARRSASWRRTRRRHGRALMVIEGHYSMDGDVPDLARFVEMARAARRAADGGRGAFARRARRHRPRHASSIAASTPARSTSGWARCPRRSRPAAATSPARAALVDLLRHTAPGFVYSVGLAPPLAAAALASLRLLQAEPWRVARLQANARAVPAPGAGGAASTPAARPGLGIVPVILGSSVRGGAAGGGAVRGAA